MEQKLTIVQEVTPSLGIPENMEHMERTVEQILSSFTVYGLT
jgi:hypothetical protein